MFTYFIISLSISLIAGCAHRYTEEEYKSVASELGTCKQHNEACIAEKARLDKELRDALKKLEKASTDITEGYSNKQELLDANIVCMEENKTLLKQISKFKALLQERKDAQWRLNKSYEYLNGFLQSERINDQLYIVKSENTLKIIIPQRVLFPAASSAWLTPKGIALVKKIAKGVFETKPLYIEIAGHTDTAQIPRQVIRAYPTHWDLAHARAVSVLLVFEGMGIKKDKLSAVSFGDTRPIADVTTEEGKAMNRRVEIVITP